MAAWTGQKRVAQKVSISAARMAANLEFEKVDERVEWWADLRDAGEVALMVDVRVFLMAVLMADKRV